jgi:anti-sigma28 factor (negative regulator of flagellin synthesis)
MIIPIGRVNKTLEIHLQKIYATNPTRAADKIGGSDVVSISKFSALLERGRAAALALPEVRADRVAQAKASLEKGEVASSSELAAAIINAVIEGQV